MPVEGSCVDLWGKHHIWLLASRHAHRLAGGYSLSPVYHRLYPEGECAHAGLHDIVCTMPDGPVQHTREVNHIEPRNGMGYGSGCFNHQSNLEVLCRAHHGRVSGIQARGRTLEHEIRAMERDVAAGRRMF
ncbi:MAG: hypothetical protein IH888_04265 [Planctomycetes bacterium]|nr:hypothetical protein [Planctomycetota bacterium]